MTDAPTPSEVRQNLKLRADARDASLSALSRLIGRNAAYLQQFIERGTPRRLNEDDRLKLAKYLVMDERLLGARQPWSPAIVDQAGPE